MRPATAILSSRPQAIMLRSVRLLTCLCLLAQPFAAVAQTDVPEPLPPAAQELFDKGIMSAREQGYLVAIRYLQEARKLAPQAPQIFRSLGAVEAKIPGRELRAMAWYGAYLAALPKVPDATEVKNEIVRLEMKNQINISGLINSAQKAAAAVPVPDRTDYYYNAARWGNRIQVAVLWAKAGDIASALNTAQLLDDDIRRSSAQSQIAEVQAKAGDIAGALTSADLITRLDFKSKALLRVGEIQTAAGDFTGAQKTLTLAEKIAESRVGVAPDYETDFEMSAIASAKVKAGDIAGARKTVTFIKKDDSALNPQKSAPQLAIARAQAEAGDIVGALQTADLIQHASLKDLALRDIADAQAKARIPQAPNSTVNSSSASKPERQPAIKVSDWLKKLDDGNKDHYSALNTEPFLDLAGYLKSLPPSDNPQKVFDSLHETAMKIIGAQNVITGMLKQQSGK